MENLRISTITSVLRISQDINLKKIYEEIPISNQYIPFIEYGVGNIPRGFSKKSLRKKRKQKPKKIFYNQATLHVIHDNKIMNVKLFNNGRIQITGLKGEGQSVCLVNTLLDYFKDFDIVSENTHLVDSKIVLINSDFDIGFEIDRDKLHRDIISNDIYSSYEPCIYPGVNIKYFINNNNDGSGVCVCDKLCNGKGNGDGDGRCKKVTVAVFKSGKIIITGGQNIRQIEDSYEFITDFIEDKKEYYSINYK
jgi:TATA-box binding protein (TBP) (component of TFIID and TFIIIB)